MSTNHDDADRAVQDAAAILATYLTSHPDDAAELAMLDRHRTPDTLESLIRRFRERGATADDIRQAIAELPPHAVAALLEDEK